MTAHLARVLVLAASFAALVALRIVQLEQPSTSRTHVLLALAAVAGALAWIGTAIVLRVVGLKATSRSRTLAVLVLMSLGVVAAMATVYTVYDRTILGHIEDDGREGAALVGLWIWSHASGLYVFAVAGLRYVLPWPAPLLAILAAVVDLRLSRAPSRLAGIAAR